MKPSDSNILECVEMEGVSSASSSEPNNMVWESLLRPSQTVPTPSSSTSTHQPGHGFADHWGGQQNHTEEEDMEWESENIEVIM